MTTGEDDERRRGRAAGAGLAIVRQKVEMGAVGSAV